MAGGKLTAGQSQSSCGPVNTCPEWGPWSSPGAQQLCQHFPRVGHCSELTNPHLCDTQRTVPDGKVPTHLSTLLEVWPLPVGKCKGTWCEHFTDVEWNFFMGTFRHRELGVYIVYLCVWIDRGMNVTASNLLLSHCYNYSEPYGIALLKYLNCQVLLNTFAPLSLHPYALHSHPLLHSWLLCKSSNHRTVKVWRDHWRLSRAISLLKQDPLEHITQECVQTTFDYLQ